MESRIDSDQDGLPDLVKVNIIRPRYEGKIPAVMTASPYHQGTNDKASDKALYNMNVDLEVKEPHTIDPNKCVKCGACMEKCRFGAIYKE